MSYSDQSTPFVPYHNGLDSMGYWSQFLSRNENNEQNGQLEHGPPMKRPKNCDDNNQHVVNRSPQTNLPVNQPIGKIFFKTRLCAKFRMGQCKNGADCNFAHGEDDLRKPPPNWQELVAGRSDDRGGNRNGNGNGNGKWEDDDSFIHRMKLCKKFYNGEECPYGDRCNFVHKEPAKLRDNSSWFRDNRDNSSRETFAISIGTTGRPLIQAEDLDVNDLMNVGADRGNVKPIYWKTRTCTKFEVTGHCPFGDSCHFAHGQAELLPGVGRSSEVESVIVTSGPPKPAPLLANEPVPVKIDSGASLNQQGQGKKCHFKWKGTKKINRIYGDWLDDLPLNLPNQVGT